MKNEFNHAANDSPRSGSSKRVTPLVWFAIVVCIVAIAHLVWHQGVMRFIPGAIRLSPEQSQSPGIALA